MWHAYCKAYKMQNRQRAASGVLKLSILDSLLCLIYLSKIFSKNSSFQKNIRGVYLWLHKSGSVVSENFYFHIHDSIFQHIDAFCSSRRYINNPVVITERPPVIDAYNDAFPVFQVYYANYCTEEKCSVSGSEFVHIKYFSARRFSAVEFFSVVNRLSPVCRPHRAVFLMPPDLIFFPFSCGTGACTSA